VGLLNGRVAIVTGAGRGLGRCEALALAKEGARVVVNDVGTSVHGEGTDVSPPADVVREIVAGGGEAVVGHADVASWDGARATVDQAYDTWGRLDVLVNNAGVLRDRMLFNMAEDEFDAVMRVHAKGHFAMTRHACTRWREAAKGGATIAGRIVNTASEAGLLGTAGNSNYAMAKAAIAALTVSTAREMAKYGVTANFMAPRARTRMTDTMGASAAMFAKPEAGLDRFDPAWPAQLVVFLATDAAADVNGQGFIVWGGEVTLVKGWHPVRHLSQPDAGFTAHDLIRRKDELFGDVSRQPEF
jgi:NAD(P)-dependent dehydrogenase (short-subunit alcohol dehydrogenase family)